MGLHFECGNGWSSTKRRWNSENSIQTPMENGWIELLILSQISKVNIFLTNIFIHKINRNVDHVWMLKIGFNVILWFFIAMVTANIDENNSVSVEDNM